MIRPNAFPASCEVETGNQLPAWSAIRWSSQIARNESASTPIATATQPGVSWKSSRHEVKTSSRLGRST